MKLQMKIKIQVIYNNILLWVNIKAKKSVIISKNPQNSVGIPTTKEELVKSLMQMQKENQTNSYLKQLKSNNQNNQNVNKSTVHDTQQLADQIKKNNLIPSEKETSKPQFDQTFGKGINANELLQSEIQSVSQTEISPKFKTKKVEFKNGWTLKAPVLEDDDGNLTDINGEREGILFSPNHSQYKVKFSKMAGSSMGVLNDFENQKVFFINLQTKEITPTG